MSFLKRKPRTPDTPAKRYEREMDRIFALGVLTGMSATVAAVALTEVKAMIEYGSWASSYGWGGVAVLLALGFGAGFFATYRFVKLKKGLRKHAPAEDEIVGPMTEHQGPQA